MCIDHEQDGGDPELNQLFKEVDKVNKHEILNLRVNITFKLMVFSFVLYMVFWFIFLGRVSRYLSLAFSMLFLGFCVYNFVLYYRIQKELRK